MNLEEIEAEIYAIYQFYAVAAPGVTPQEILPDETLTTLGSFWALFDMKIGESDG